MNEILKFWKSVDTHILIEIALTLVLIVAFFIVKKIIAKLIRNHAIKLMHTKAGVTYVIKLANFGLILIFITLIAIVWEISFRGLSVYFASFFTIVGVAFFASWSILSNVTARVCL
jgi:MscS family membrane protein